MTVPVLTEVLQQNPDLEIVMVSRSNFEALFTGIPRLIFKGIDVDEFDGFFGIRKLAKLLIADFQPDIVIDLHDVIRTKILNRFLKRKNFPIFVIDKGKEEKELLTDIWNLEKKPLKLNTERYADVFREAGFPLVLAHRFDAGTQVRKGIGFAPFAQHKGKMLPLEKSFELAKILSASHNVYFFGGGKTETETLNSWVEQLPGTASMAGKFTLKEELEKIATLEVMISMDSANMHLASLVGTRCVSIWGSTHPYAGFLGYGQNIQDVVQVKDLSCRPCSVFGDLPCYREDWACLHEINIQQIIDRL